MSAVSQQQALEARAAAAALDHACAWACLREDAATRDSLVRALEAQAGVVSAQLLLHRLKDGGVETGVERLESMASALLGTCASATEPPSGDDQVALVQLLIELSSCPALPDRSPLQRLRPCAICGLATIGAPGLVTPDSLPYDGASTPEGEGDVLIWRLLMRSVVPKGKAGWVLTRVPACCHWVHDHCSVKLFAPAWTAPGTNPRCPVCPTTDPYTALEWRYGYSGTRYELGLVDQKEPVDSREHLAQYDPRDRDAVTRLEPLDGHQAEIVMDEGGPSGIDSGGGDAGPPLPPGDDDEKEKGLIEMCAQALAEFGNLSIEDVYAVLCEEKGFVHLTRGDLEAPYAEAQERRRLSARLANTGGMEAEEPLLPEGVEVGGVCLATLWSDGVPQRFKAVLDCVRSSTDDAPLFVELVATEGGAPFETAPPSTHAFLHPDEVSVWVPPEQRQDAGPLLGSVPAPPAARLLPAEQLDALLHERGHAFGTTRDAQ